MDSGPQDPRPGKNSGSCYLFAGYRNNTYVILEEQRYGAIICLTCFSDIGLETILITKSNPSVPLPSPDLPREAEHFGWEDTIEVADYAIAR